MRVLIFKVNQLGDNVVFLPVVQEMRRRFPHWELSVFTSPTAAALYQRDIAPHRLFVAPTAKFNGSWKRPWDFAGLWRKAALFSPNACLLAEDQANVAYALSFLSGSPVRVAMERSFIKLGGLATTLVPSGTGERVVMANWRIAQALVESIKESGWPETPPPPDLSHLTMMPGAAAAYSRPRIVIHPGASRSYQCWFPDRYVALANRLQADGRWDVCWIDTPGFPVVELSVTVRRVRTPALHDLVQVLDGAALFVGNNSGPMHLANALGCRCVIINGPTTPHWDPFWYAERMLMLRDESLPCLPCDAIYPPTNECRNYADPMACMKFWAVEAIFQRCMEWIERPDLKSQDQALPALPPR